MRSFTTELINNLSKGMTFKESFDETKDRL